MLLDNTISINNFAVCSLIGLEQVVYLHVYINLMPCQSSYFQRSSCAVLGLVFPVVPPLLRNCAIYSLIGRLHTCTDICNNYVTCWHSWPMFMQEATRSFDCQCFAQVSKSCVTYTIWQSVLLGVLHLLWTWRMFCPTLSYRFRILEQEQNSNISFGS